jgi:hypothetical protein
VAATLVGHVAEWLGSPHAPFVVAAVCCLIAAVLLAARQRQQPDSHTVAPEAVLVGEKF